MGAPTRIELEAAFQKYLRLGAFERNWNAWADLFTEDAYYYECQYGTFHGRAAIRKWITSVMAGVPDMFFPSPKWVVLDADRVCFCIENCYPDPKNLNGPAIGFPTFTCLQYRDGLWCSEEDYYDVRASVAARQAFRAAGGKAAPPIDSRR
ncbi:MAG TPA: nuclear transport factor 2 family protein [Candidatus Margulisiibacteriota bacterium]|nr:nuclear transport factor 2 family protein [Candidatus Margulisiibacteriota bacterium]